MAVTLSRGRRTLQGAILAGLVLLTVPTNLHFVSRDIQIATSARFSLNELPAFWPKADLEAIRWARRNLPRDGVIFCSTVNGRLFPALAGRPVYVGHWSETPQANERMEEVIGFYRNAGTPSEERRAFLEARNIRYVYHGTEERLLGQVDLASDPLFRPVYHKNGVAIYELGDEPHRLAAGLRVGGKQPAPEGEPGSEIEHQHGDGVVGGVEGEGSGE